MLRLLRGPGSFSIVYAAAFLVAGLSIVSCSSNIRNWLRSHECRQQQNMSKAEGIEFV
jgi:hypothetical protein